MSQQTSINLISVKDTEDYDISKNVTSKVDKIGDIVYGRAYILKQEDGTWRDWPVVPWEIFCGEWVVCVAANVPYFMGLPEYIVVHMPELWEFEKIEQQAGAVYRCRLEIAAREQIRIMYQIADAAGVKFCTGCRK